jgi:capsular exopolysaccharide synthesis family protein
MSSEDKGAVEASLLEAGGQRPEVAAEIAGAQGLHGLLVILRDPESPVAESIRSIRTGLQRHLAAGVNSLMVLSPWGGDGKSTVCANLAASLSQLFIDVILVDADLRKPTLSRVFGSEGRPGLTDCLEGTAVVSDVIQDTGVDRLRFVAAGSASRNPADLLGRDALVGILQELRTMCQCLIIDTSPLTACGDALLIGAQVNRAIMVINPKNWQGDAEARVRELLQEHGVEVLGIVLNATDDRAEGSSYGYGYGYGYGQSRGSGSGARGRSPEGTARGGTKTRGGILRKLWQRLWAGHRERE